MRLKMLILLSFLVIGTSVNNSFAALIVPAASVTTEPDPAKVKEAVDAFKNLSKKEKKERAREVKKEIKAYKAAKKSGKDADTNTLLLVILAILLPPLAVYLHEGEINNRFWISLLLTLLFWLPGVIYALIIILGDN
ncbi:MAG TPA: YqaE/Pmp3 family membrane protein [Chitinophagaceae bacterium]|nr:YqaE/Pmp3 family membrane protein [Chitinophagaceae bacterium]HQX73946.1 YqaE/Pmp3 family membrane protein [Chitinophagaceae bacterium]HQZ75869.1 YqaE/Pmp3 family membrane protein [Chitinophagaceae bacterium]